MMRVAMMALAIAVGWASSTIHVYAQDVTAAEAREIAKEAYIYGFPMVDHYRIQYSYFENKDDPNYKAAWNTLINIPRVYTPDDTAIQTPNSDTPYSFIGMDLRAEPLVITVPPIEKNRYFSVQLIDAYTHNFAYMGSRTTGNDGGSFLIAGPNWKGETPKGVKKVIRSETEFVFAAFRTQLFNPADLENVKKVQAGYKAQPLSAFLGQPAAATAPAIDFIKPLTPDGQRSSVEFYNILNFVLQFSPTVPSETDLRARFAKIGMGSGKAFDANKLSPEMKSAMEQGMADALTEYAAFQKRIDAGEVTSGEMFGTREYLKNNYLVRMGGAVNGIYGNSRDEAIYPLFALDSDGQKPNGANRYRLRFAPGQLPPVNAFWSLTMYRMPEILLVDNPIDRYLVNSPMLSQFKRDADGGLTLLIQNDSPGADMESNWLPAPKGWFMPVMRLYWPKKEALDGTWAPPKLVKEQAAMNPGQPGQGSPKYSANVPDSILTPDTVETRIGTLKFFDGMPSEETARIAYDNLDFMNGVRSFLSAMPAASIYGMCKGLKDAGAYPHDVGIFENLMDARSLFLTANSTTVYFTTCFDLNQGPVVMELPAGTLGPLDDAFFRWVSDVGITGPDQGRGGKYLLVPPGYTGEIPLQGYHVLKPKTLTNWLLARAFVKDGDIKATVKGVKDAMRIYPLSQAGKSPPQKFVDLSGQKINTVHANDENFFEEVNSVIQAEPADAFDPEIVGVLSAIGIKKGQEFKPDARMRAILKDAAAVGNATARTIVFATRDERAKFFPDRQWKTSFIGGSFEFMNNGELMLDARTLFHYYATGITPAMAASAPGTGSSYAFAERDSEGRYLDGGKTYKITLPAPIPVNNFWSFMVYSGQTRSMLETDQKLAGMDSNNPSVKPNEDGSYTMWFGPKSPPGKEGNWIQTMPGKSWNTLLRLYGPLEPWYNKTWKPSDFELVDDASIPERKKPMAPPQERSETEGATAIKARLTVDGRIAIYGINFDTNEAEVKPESMETIANIAKVLQENPELKIAVVGHTDSLGSHAVNMQLSKLRADAVVRVLQNQYKIDANRLLAAGAGFLAPIASNATEEGRALNRRVELIRSK